MVDMVTPPSKNESPVYLNDTWSFYFHDPHNADWRTCSYHKVSDVSTAQDYWAVQDKLGENLCKGMFFLMREHIFPCWDDESNIKGGCMSLKVLKQDLLDFWNELVTMILTENLLYDEHKAGWWNMINGISTSPKKHFCIVKIWLGNTDIDKQHLRIPSKYHGDIIFKSNMDNINNDKVNVFEENAITTCKSGGGSSKPFYRRPLMATTTA